MSNKRNQNTKYYVGIDGGGTKCKALLADHNGNILGNGISGPANPASNFELALTSIVESVELAFKQADIAIENMQYVDAVMGLAGINVSPFKQKMQAWQHPFNSVHFTTDLHVACLGAHNGEDGAIIIAGTGSSGISVANNQHFVIGGHGLSLGDKGGGAWMGLSAVKASLEALDGLAPHSKLVNNVQHFLCGILDNKDADKDKNKDEAENVNVKAANTMASIAIGQPPAFFARLAPLVFEAAENNDALAKAIVEEGAGYLAAMAKRLLAQESLSRNKNKRLAMIGGLAPQILNCLDEKIKTKFSAPLQTPDYGALLLAQQLNK